MSAEWARELLKAAGLYARDKALCDEVLSTLARHGALHPLEAHGHVVWQELMRQAVIHYTWGGSPPHAEGVSSAQGILSAAGMVAHLFGLGDDVLDWTRECENVVLGKEQRQLDMRAVLRRAILEATYGVSEGAPTEDMLGLMEALDSGHLPLVTDEERELAEQLRRLLEGVLADRETPMCRACGVAYVVEGNDLCMGCTALYDAGALVTDAGPVGG